MSGLVGSGMSVVVACLRNSTAKAQGRGSGNEKLLREATETEANELATQK